ncbi:macrolide export ATP-binding/permease protein MacB [mine drainage metagenome]|uniref:Macrolide export ATP-binding/permease protein MacB n=1 Tax=mine drainage metagenome TaxID=410659 RepID=A0A1J5S626_9ZZZZ
MHSDLRLAFRSLLKSPGFTAIAIVTLALGIGLSTSAFSLANAFLLRLLSYPNSAELVRVFRSTPQARGQSHSPADYLDIHNGATCFSDSASYYNDLNSLAEPDQPAQQVSGLWVASNFLKLIGVQPSIGRDFTPDENQPGKGNVVILTQRLWSSRFSSDPKVIGRTLRINGENCTVIGVLPKSFAAPLVWGPADFLRPLTMNPGFSTLRKDHWFSCVARLKPGVTIGGANAQLASIASRLSHDYPTEDGGEGLYAVPLHSSNMDGTSTRIIWMMTGLALMVLLIACANLASLLLARSLGRTREFAIRTALGASRFRLMSPLLAESLVLSMAGGGLGLLLGKWSNDLLAAKILIGNEPGFPIPIDGRVLTFALLTSLATTLVFGLAPALLVSRAPVNDALKEGVRGSSAGRSHHRFKCSLVVAEIAAALILVGVSASFAVASKGFLHRNLGWQPEGTFEGLLARPWNRYGTDDLRRQSDRALLDRLSSIPGVEKAALSFATPLFSYFNSSNFVAEGQPLPEKGKEPLVETNSVTPGFFSLLHIPLKQGSLFTDSIKADGPPVAIVNESFVRRFWPGQNPIGRRVRIADKDQWIRIIGVVGDVRMAANISAPTSFLQLYRPMIQAPGNYITFVLRSSMPPESLAHSAAKIVSSLDPDLPITQAGSTTQLIQTSLSNLDVIVVNLAVFAAMGLLIAAIGIYGVIAHLTAQRTLDIGVRMALGARQSQIVSMILTQGAQLLAIGLVLGVIGAYAIDSMLQRTMSEFGLPGAWMQGLTVCLISLITLVACYIPARRASLIDPVIALRGE